MNKVILINVPCHNILDDKLEPPMGLLYIQSFLLDEGVDCEIYDMCIERNTIDNIPESDIYGFTTYTNNFSSCCSIAKSLKERYPRSTTVAGGYHVSALNYDSYKNFDITVIGEGEKAMRSLSDPDLLGFYKREKLMVGDCIDELDDLPFPRYDKDVKRRHKKMKNELLKLHSWSKN